MGAAAALLPMCHSPGQHWRACLASTSVQLSCLPLRGPALSAGRGLKLWKPFSLLLLCFLTSSAATFVSVLSLQSHWRASVVHLRHTRQTPALGSFLPGTLLFQVSARVSPLPPPSLDLNVTFSMRLLYLPPVQYCHTACVRPQPLQPNSPYLVFLFFKCHLSPSNILFITYLAGIHLSFSLSVPIGI